jgi:hypothetical protein
MDWRYIPYNEKFYPNLQKGRKSEMDTKLLKRKTSSKYKKAPAAFYPDRGISGIVGYALKRIYNFSNEFKTQF